VHEPPEQVPEAANVRRVFAPGQVGDGGLSQTMLTHGSVTHASAEQVHVISDEL
jgi:hypothetical protein